MWKVTRGAFVVFLTCVCAPAVAQAQATITGVVRDSTRGVLPGVTVTAASPTLPGIERSTKSDDGGRYRIDDLPTGTYVVTFSLRGFITIRRAGITVSAASSRELDAALPPMMTTATATPVLPDVPAVVSQNQPRTAPSDFAFRFESHLCVTDRMSTFEGTLTRAADSPWYSGGSIPLVLTAPSMREIYDAIVAARFFEYPTYFVPEVYTSVVVPVTHYQLEVRSGGVTHAVSWRDARGTPTEDAKRLLALFQVITRVLYGQPDVKDTLFGVVVPCA